MQFFFYLGYLSLYLLSVELGSIQLLRISHNSLVMAKVLVKEKGKWTSCDAH